MEISHCIVSLAVNFSFNNTTDKTLPAPCILVRNTAHYHKGFYFPSIARSNYIPIKLAWLACSGCINHFKEWMPSFSQSGWWEIRSLPWASKWMSLRSTALRPSRSKRERDIQDGRARGSEYKLLGKKLALVFQFSILFSKFLVFKLKCGR